MAESKVVFIDNMRFIGSSNSGHSVVMDAPASVGGSNTASTPMEILLSALGGCTGMDVISIMRKKKQNVTGLELNVKGEKAEDYPHRYTAIHIEYVITGKNISDEAVKRAIELSLEKYCSVGATIGNSADITNSYKIIQGN